MRHGKYPFILAFLLPPVAIYVYFVLSPYAQAFYFSLTNWTGTTATQDFIGLDNFVRAWNDDQLRIALRNNFLLLAVVPLVTVLLGLFFASMLNVGGRGKAGGVQGVRGSSIYKVVYFFPVILSVPIIAAIFLQVFSPSVAGGLLNTILEALGLGRFTIAGGWLSHPTLAFWVVIVAMIWSFTGFFVVLFSAAMQSIPRDIYEAALLDGASRLTTFRKVTIPLVWDTVQVAWVYLAIQAMDGFALVHILLGIGGGPSRNGDVLGVAVYRAAFSDFRFGYAAAIGVILTILTMIIAIISMRLARRERVELA
jgi:N-acetylglucosamine transport system permease protein